MVEEKKQVIEQLSNMISALDELHLNLEPIRDKALDQRAFYTGYSSCAETMIKIIVTKAEHLKNQIKLIEAGNLDKSDGKNSKEDIENVEEVPLIIDPEDNKRKEVKIN